MKKLLLIVTLLASIFTFSQSKNYLTTLRFDKSAKFDELIHSFDNQQSEVGYFEFSITNDIPTELHFHGNNNTTCKTYTITEYKFDVTFGDIVYDKYICKNSSNEITEVFIYMDKNYTKFNVMVSNKDSRGIIYTCNSLEINDYKDLNSSKVLDNWYINKTIYELKSMK